MGVDASLFARDAKRYFHFDRLRNITEFLNGCFPDEYEADISELYDVLRDSKQGLALAQLKKFLAANEIAYAKNPQRVTYSGWIRSLLEFAKKHPYDTFFVLADNQEEYYECDKTYETEAEE